MRTGLNKSMSGGGIHKTKSDFKYISLTYFPTFKKNL